MARLQLGNGTKPCAHDIACARTHTTTMHHTCTCNKFSPRSSREEARHPHRRFYRCSIVFVLLRFIPDTRDVGHHRCRFDGKGGRITPENTVQSRNTDDETARWRAPHAARPWWHVRPFPGRVAACPAWELRLTTADFWKCDSTRWFRRR